jgi:hypothetical protein
MRSSYKGKWEQFRNQVIELDGRKCLRCGKTEDDGAILHVHHKQYIQGRAAWDYPPSYCEALCAGCHAIAHGIIPPDCGWEFIGDEDAGSRSQNCDYCMNLIRYCFQIRHKTWGEMWVGEDCCNHLTGTEQASRRVDDLKKRVERRERFIDKSKWRINYGEDDGVSYFNRLAGVHLRIAHEHDGLRIYWNSRRGKVLYPSFAEAAAVAFDKIESGEIRKYLDSASGRK